MKLLLIAMLAAGTLAGCGASTKTVTVPAATPTGTAPPPAPPAAGVGDTQTVTLDDSQGNGGGQQAVTLLQVKRFPAHTCDADGLNCAGARHGEALVGVRVSVATKGTRMRECASNSATLANSAGDEFKALPFDPYVGRTFDCAQRRAGQKARGWIVFSVPKHPQRLTFSWRPNNGNNADDVEWPIGSRP